MPESGRTAATAKVSYPAPQTAAADVAAVADAAARGHKDPILLFLRTPHASECQLQSKK